VRALARWCAVSWPAACAGALSAGLVESVAMGAPFEIAAGAAFLVMFALPVSWALSLVTRAVWAAWQPSELANELVDPERGAPALAGWLGFAYLAALVLGAAVFGSTHLLAARTEFRPMVVGFALPVFSVGAALVLLACSRPVASGLACVAEAIDRRWRARGRATLLAPRRVVVALGAVVLATLLVAWSWVHPRLGHLDISPVYGPAAGLAITLALHLIRRELRWVRRGLTVVAALALGLALYTWRARPDVMLAVWGELPVAGVLIDQVFDLHALRDQISPDAFRPAERAGAPHPDLVLITIDTVRADRTPPYGGPAEMPALAGLAARGAVFEWAFSPSNVTRRSIPSMMTGVQPNRVRGRVVGWALRIDPRHVMIAERLRAGGYQTAGFMCCGSFWGDEARTGLSRGLAHLEIERDGHQLAARARAWIERQDREPGRKPLFVWIHILEPHNWTSGSPDPAGHDSRRRLYDRSLAEADKMLAEVFRAFDKRAPGAAPVVVVSADHGEALGDHGQPHHSTDLYNSQIRVPFVVAGPGIRQARIAEPVSLTDLSPTLLELAGFVPHSADGRSLAPLLTGARTPDRDGGLAYAAMIKDRSNPGGVTAIVAGAWKLISVRGRYELYHLAVDPDEKTDVAAQHPDKVAELRALLEARGQLQTSPFP